MNNEVKELLQRILSFAICFTMELGYMYAIPAAYEAGGGWWYLMLGGAVVMGAVTSYEFMSFITWLFEVMNWDDEGL